MKDDNLINCIYIKHLSIRDYFNIKVHLCDYGDRLNYLETLEIHGVEL